MVLQVFLYYCAAAIGAAIGYLAACLMRSAKEPEDRT